MKTKPLAAKLTDKFKPLHHYAYGPRTRVQQTFTGTGRTKQSHKDECDINQIMKRFETTGIITHINQSTPRYGDFPQVDFQDALNIVKDAQARFAELPSTIRDRFSNDPQKLLLFLQNPENRDEARKLGLLRPEQGGKGGAAPPPQESNLDPSTQAVEASKTQTPPG